MLTNSLKKLTYRLHYRGIKELDIFFGRVADQLSELSSDELAILEQLIDESEDKIYRWVLGFEEKPTHYKKIIEKLLT
ncbi:succinate dehydrogenase assembly factor 2 [Candidatus Bodocaedibacter vickermanii]|uniref:FAD assembly factor SdhE n=1 Tax=Candidatus Bodocaedibacter vickermanii TaxID=2741701 RepID=A0A7L9RUB8_9PROT|nr:succinate dehydrogenase assembly factor 2 [Candidatus Paracaedibacteraceae bacterium 'Lake Konstanz']